MAEGQSGNGGDRPARADHAGDGTGAPAREDGLESVRRLFPEVLERLAARTAAHRPALAAGLPSTAEPAYRFDPSDMEDGA